MATIFIPVEVPDDKLHEFLGYATGAGVNPLPWKDSGPAPQAQPVPNQAPPLPPAPAVAPADPWAQQAPAPQQAYVPTPSSQIQPQYQPPAPQAQFQAPQSAPPGAPTCPHGVRPYIANGKYGPFWGCPADRNDPSKCKALKAS